MFTLLLVALFATVCPIVAISTISAKGSKFFTSDGNQFYVKGLGSSSCSCFHEANHAPGIAYQLVDNDPLVDNAQCQRDANLMKTLGANSIRVYHVDASANHDACMQTFADAGIYTWIDLDTFDTYILFNGNPPRWTQTMYKAYQRVMDTFQKYDNVAGFFVGNEMLTVGTDSVAAPYIKAAARDMKSYRDKQGYRQIPVGYSAADITALRPNLQNYLACGSKPSESLDFYSLNAYEWCGQSTYNVSGYDVLQKNASNYNIPIFFSETGCIYPKPRTFDDQSAIFGSEMADTWSGAIIYEWIEETNNYGLISYGPPTNPAATASNVIGGFTRSGTPTPISPDFDNLSSQWATLSPSGVAANAYTSSHTPPPCPAYTSGLWEVSGTVPLPTIGAKGAVYTTGQTTGQTTGLSATMGSSSAASSTTSDSSAASATRASSVALSRRRSDGLWSWLMESKWVHYSAAVVGCLSLVVVAA